MEMITQFTRVWIMPLATPVRGMVVRDFADGTKLVRDKMGHVARYHLADLEEDHDAED
jgi:hypothetical protein